MNILWVCKPFSALTIDELYAILQLRNEVFVVEQNCPYQDCDNNDQQSFHFMGWHINKLVAYTRLIPPNITYQEISIGRVVTSPLVRRNNLGKELMKNSSEKIYELFGHQPIKIGAQLYLKKFYQDFGFTQISDVYLEDGIEHIKMLKI
jgi:ElaA protein